MEETNQNTKIKKQEAIRLAYEEYWEEMKPFINESGWFDKNSFYNKLFSFNYEQINILFAHKEDFMIPKSIENIEDNNGWISILSEEDLPKEKISYEVWRNGYESRATYAGSDRWFVPHNDFPKTTKVAGITHYAEPIKRQSPIF